MCFKCQYLGMGSEKDERDEQKNINRKENSRDKKINKKLLIM